MKLLGVSVLLGAVACGAATAPAPTDAASPIDGVCQVSQMQHPTDDPPASHVSNVMGIAYASNPPASGPHCSSLGAYGLHPPQAPLSRCHYIHNLEHGGMALLYNCPAGCPEIVAGLERAMARAATPAGCRDKPILITPDAELDVAVAATAWGHTWKSNCLDAGAETALVAFIDAHLAGAGDAPEKSLACF